MQSVLQSTVSIICIVAQKRKLTCREKDLFRGAAESAEPAVQPASPLPHVLCSGFSPFPPLVWWLSAMSVNHTEVLFEPLQPCRHPGESSPACYKCGLARYQLPDLWLWWWILLNCTIFILCLMFKTGNQWKRLFTDEYRIILSVALLLWPFASQMLPHVLHSPMEQVPCVLCGLELWSEWSYYSDASQKAFCCTTAWLWLELHRWGYSYSKGSFGFFKLFRKSWRIC